MDSYLTAFDRPRRSGPTRFEVATDPEGRFRFAAVPGPAFSLVARSPDRSVVAVHEDFQLDGREVVVRVGPGDRASGFVEGVLVGPDGDAPIGSFATVGSARGFDCLSAELTGARFRLGPLRAGEHLMSAGAEGFGRLHGPLALVADATLDLGTLTLDRPGWIEVRSSVRGATPRPDEVVLIGLWRDGKWRAGGIRTLAEAVRSDVLAPGRYLLRTRGMRHRAADRVVEVRSGETTAIELELVPATERVLALRVPSGDPSTHVRLRVLDAAGNTVEDDELTYRELDCFWRGVLGLTGGTYRVEAHSPTGRSLLGELFVPDLAVDHEAHEFRLR